jgi:hypothetical protein
MVRLSAIFLFFILPGIVQGASVEEIQILNSQSLLKENLEIVRKFPTFYTTLPTPDEVQRAGAFYLRFMEAYYAEIFSRNLDMTYNSKWGEFVRVGAKEKSYPVPSLGNTFTGQRIFNRSIQPDLRTHKIFDTVFANYQECIDFRGERVVFGTDWLTAMASLQTKLENFNSNGQIWSNPGLLEKEGSLADQIESLFIPGAHDAPWVHELQPEVAFQIYQVLNILRQNRNDSSDTIIDIKFRINMLKGRLSDYLLARTLEKFSSKPEALNTEFRNDLVKAQRGELFPSHEQRLKTFRSQ